MCVGSLCTGSVNSDDDDDKKKKERKEMSAPCAER